jgi:hypothetical protein
MITWRPDSRKRPAHAAAVDKGASSRTVVLVNTRSDHLLPLYGQEGERRDFR